MPVTSTHLQIHLADADLYPIADELGDLSLGEAISEESVDITAGVGRAELPGACRRTPPAARTRGSETLPRAW
jgi:hypothetical protein